MQSQAPKASMEFFARCASGFEAVLGEELKALGARQVRPLKGGVSFAGGIECGLRACLWCHIATRIQVVLVRVGASDAEALYAGAFDFPWENHVAPDATIAVRAHGENPQLRNTQFTALKVKDAICDRLRRVRGHRPDVDAKNPGFAVDVSLHRTKATLYLDLSGESLHRRGYRQDGLQTAAPLKETLAAGMLLAAGWADAVRSPAAGAASPSVEAPMFIDPMCGSGTLAIEAALIAADAAPGILRTSWGFQGWLRHDANIWARLLDEADRRLEAGLQTDVRVVAGDCDGQAVEIARANVRRAGVEGIVEFRVAEAAELAAELSCDADVRPTGLLAVNPPYGHRMLSAGQLPKTYAALASVVDALPSHGWRLAVITPDPSVDTALGQVPERVLACYNGPMETAVRLYRVQLSNRTELQVVSLSGNACTVAVAERNSEQFAARLRKVARERAKWARKAGVSCYRIYDADLPDYAVAIDLYTEDVTGRRFVCLAEYQAPADIDPAKALRRFGDVVAIVPTVLDVEPACVHVKQRRREKGGGQYRHERGVGAPVLVRESGYLFKVDLDGRLDTGLFLDHRLTRQLVASLAQGARFLNLFAYTGTASVYAAGAGASHTVTVDLSQTYLAWAQRNMEANGFKGRRHRFEHADVLQWLRRERQRGNSYDLVFCDPPTFSNSKSMGKSTWSVQRDHVALLALVEGVLAPGGTIVFSCNLRNFKMDAQGLAERGLSFEDVTARTIPHDFQRNPKVHHCYVVRRLSRDCL